MSIRLALLDSTLRTDGGPIDFTPNGRRVIEIGRDQFLDWMLPDPSRLLSGRHCTIENREGSYWLSDTSTNGTFVNGSEQRVQSPYRLRDGDRVTLGPYIVVVAIEEGQADPSHSDAMNGDLPFGANEAFAPPIDPRSLRPEAPGRHGVDFPDWSADLPSLELQARSRPGADPSPQDSWLPSSGAPAVRSSARVTAPAPIFTADEAHNVWTGTAQVPASDPGPPPAVAPERQSRENVSDLLQRFAKGAGLSDTVLAGTDPADFAERLGGLLRTVTEQTSRLLQARQTAKRLARSAEHTTIAALDNNPLKFAPGPEEALTLMLGGRQRAYLPAEKAFEAAFADLIDHQLRTFSAMQGAVQALEGVIGPDAIAQASPAESGLSGLLHSRKTMLWDAFVARWEGRTRPHDGLVGAFMLDFARCYDDPKHEAGAGRSGRGKA